jgi:hypothetical protein
VLPVNVRDLAVYRLKEISDYATSPVYTDEQLADLERRFGRDGVVELTYRIALENLCSRMYSASPGRALARPAACHGPTKPQRPQRNLGAGEFLRVCDVRGGLQQGEE